MNNPGYAFCFRSDRLHNQLRQRLSTWSDHIQSWVDKSGLPVLVIRYEDMKAEPMLTFTRATSFIGLKNNKDEIEAALKMSSFDILKKQEEEKGFSEKSASAVSFFRKGLAGEWKNVLTPEQVKRIVDAHGEMMRRFGYINQ